MIEIKKKKTKLPRKEIIIEKKHVISLLDSFFFNFLELYIILFPLTLASCFNPLNYTFTPTHYNRASTQTQSYTLCLCVYYYINRTHATHLRRNPRP